MTVVTDPVVESPVNSLQEVLSYRVLAMQHPTGELTLYAETHEQAQRLAADLEYQNYRFVTLRWSALNDRILSVFGQELTEQARSLQSSVHPELSAKTVFVRWQVLCALGACAAILLCLAVWPMATLIAGMAILTVAMLASAVFKVVMITRSLVQGRKSDRYGELSDAELPKFSLLFPLFREAEMVPRLVRVASALDYPEDKLEVMFVVEEEDTELRTVFETLTLPPNVSVLVVPDSQPKTKPKAINVALQLCTGDIVSVYDAEDQIAPEQLRQIAASFAKGGPKLGCVQTALVFRTDHHNWLTRQFTLEYGIWYDLVLPSISAFGLPVPLGGTGNHFRRDVLNEVGAWDCYNVTEDADLGMRLHFRGYKVQVEPIATIEDPNPDVFSWVSQRSRWIKGHMQTYLIYMRKPVQTYRRFGLGSFLALQMLFGLTFFSTLMNPLIWTMFLIWLVTQTTAFDVVFPEATLMIGTFNLLVMNAFFILTGLIAATLRNREELAPAAFTSIIYSFLSSAAAFKALWQLLFKPHYWEKTTHLAQHSTQQSEGVA